MSFTTIEQAKRQADERKKKQNPPASEKSLRDYFAAKAMQGIICTPINEYDDGHAAVYLSDGLSFSDGMRGRIAVASYAMADAMLRAREAT